MSRVALDTSAYSAFKRGHPQVVAHLRRAREILVPCIVLGELLGGFDAGGRSQRNRDELRLFLSTPRVRLAPAGEATAERYARIYAALRAAGRPLDKRSLDRREQHGARRGARDARPRLRPGAPDPRRGVCVGVRLR